MTDDLDARARAAAAALRESVRGLSVDAPIARRRTPRLVLAAAAVVAVVAVAIVLRHQVPDSTDVVTDDDGDVPRFVLDVPPPDLPPTGAVDLPLKDAGVVQTYWVYGDPQADNPFEDADLGVVVARGPDVAFVPPDDSREVEIAGRPASIAAPSDPLDPRSVIIELADDEVAYVDSRSLSEDALVDAAGSIVLGEDAPAVLGGLELVAVSTGASAGLIPVPLPTTAGHVAGYQSDDEAAATTVVVASVAGGEDADLVARWALGPSSRAITVRGNDGWVGSPFGDTSTIVVWRESPTNLVALIAFGLDEASVLEAAASLRVATQDEWAALLSVTGTVRVPSSARAGVTGGEAEGPSFAAYVDQDGSLCLDVETEDGSVGSCGGGGTSPLVVQTGELGAGRVVVYGYTTLGTGGAVRITADGGPVGSEAYDDAGTVFAFVVPADQRPAEITVQGQDGGRLGRAEVPAPETSGGTSATTLVG